MFVRLECGCVVIVLSPTLLIELQHEGQESTDCFRLDTSIAHLGKYQAGQYTELSITERNELVNQIEHTLRLGEAARNFSLALQHLTGLGR